MTRRALDGVRPPRGRAPRYPMRAGAKLGTNVDFSACWCEGTLRLEIAVPLLTDLE